MYSANYPSLPQKTLMLVIHTLAVLLAGWLLLGTGTETIARLVGLGWPAGDPSRRIMLFTCAVIYYLRLLLTFFVFQRRGIAWSEALTIAGWLLVIHLTFALAGGTASAPVNILDLLALVLYVAGSALNTGSELERHRWKQQPQHHGQLYTGGLFAYAMHINYFGDVLLFSGFALLTHRLVAVVIPVFMLCFFVFINIPLLDAHLKQHYGPAFDSYARRTRKLIPFVY